MQSTINLTFINILRERLGSADSLIQVIWGPRQVGKTTTTIKMSWLQGISSAINCGQDARGPKQPQLHADERYNFKAINARAAMTWL